MGQTTGQPKQLTYPQQLYAIRTWRYLRLAMIVLVVGLGVSIGYERWKTHPGCFQTSISAYYYTPVHGFFVGALVATGACLICLKANTYAEDIALNLAGMFAQLVALVPTPYPGSCASVLGTTRDRNVNIANNVFALLAVGLLGLLITGGLLARRLLAQVSLPVRPVMIGYGIAGAVWLAALLAFELTRGFFVHYAHYAAAILMFIFILVIVAINAIDYQAKSGAPSYRNRYAAVAYAMVLALVVIGIAGALGWAYWVLAIETSLIILFAVFWTIQTEELWEDGLR
ncbi:MAG: hypothetical protein M3N95_17135 [Actinomycetota bacterium]|nr:hypothetical protein [Actinomycetota bacterium]